jgi:proteic killer suppression protein
MICGTIVMDVSFASEELAELCQSRRKAVRELGMPCARKLSSRLADMSAAAHVGELVAGHPHPLKGDRSGQFSVRLDGGKRLVFSPAVIPIPVHEDGSVDWRQVTRVRVDFIGNFHDA